MKYETAYKMWKNASGTNKEKLQKLLMQHAANPFKDIECQCIWREYTGDVRKYMIYECMLKNANKILELYGKAIVDPECKERVTKQAANLTKLNLWYQARLIEEGLK